MKPPARSRPAFFGDTDALDFAPGIAAIEARAPSPLPRLVLYALTGLIAVGLLWAFIGSVDIVAVADGKLVPQSYLKIVQPAEQGTVAEILVSEGDKVVAGQVLMRMDTRLADADRRTIESDLALRRLQLRRIDAELAARPFRVERDDPIELAHQTADLYRANRQAYEDSLAQEQAIARRAQQDLVASRAIEEKLRQVVPVYRDREQAFIKLGEDGYAGKLLVLDRQRERIEKEQELAAQTAAAESALATQEQVQVRIEQIQSAYRQQLQRERTEHLGEIQRQEQELAKRLHRDSLLELKAPQAGIVKDLATHTTGTVVAPGTILMTLVPASEPLRAEIWISNDDIGFVHANQPVRIKVATFSFQKYGLIDGRILTVSADTSEARQAPGEQDSGSTRAPSAYKAIIALDRQALSRNGIEYPLAPGMTVSGEIVLGERSVFDYLTSPIQKATVEAARER